MVNYITNDHFWTKNRSWDSKFTILKFSICHHCISLVNEAPDWADLIQNSDFSKIQSDFDPLNIFLMFPRFFLTKVPTTNIPKMIRQQFSAALLVNLTSGSREFCQNPRKSTIFPCFGGWVRKEPPAWEGRFWWILLSNEICNLSSLYFSGKLKKIPSRKN